MALIDTRPVLALLLLNNVFCSSFCIPPSTSRTLSVTIPLTKDLRTNDVSRKISTTSYLDTLQTITLTESTITTSTTEPESSTPIPRPTNLTPQNPTPRAQYDSIICGGGPAGLLSAIMLSQKHGPSHRIAVIERRPTIPPSPTDETVWNDVARFYLLGIGFRGQNALRKFGVFEDFVEASVEVNGRWDWQPGQKTEEEGTVTPARKNVVSRILPRDKLVGVLHRHIVENYAEANIDLLYGFDLEPESFGDGDDDEVTVRISKCNEIASEEGTDRYTPSDQSEEVCDVDLFQLSRTKLLLAADGSARTVANAIEKHERHLHSSLNPLLRPFSPRPFRVTRYTDDNPKVYKSVPIPLPSHWPHDLNYSSRQSRVNLEALPSDAHGNLCALLLMEPDEPFAQPDVDPATLRAYFDAELPLFSALVSDEEMGKLAEKEASTLPAFRYAGPRLNCGGRTLVLGDAAHTVKPYYGLGANSALEDISMLSDALDDAAKEGEVEGDTVPAAVRLFSERRSGDAGALVKMSRNMDRPGKLFFLTFLAPLILDGMFHKLLPKVFGPNMFAMFQREDIGFRQIQRKKRLDRALQVLLLGGLLGGLGVVVGKGLGLLTRIVGRGGMLAGLGVAAAIGTVSRGKKKSPASS